MNSQNLGIFQKWSVDDNFGQAIVPVVLPYMMVVHSKLVMQDIWAGFENFVDSVWHCGNVFIAIETPVVKIDRFVTHVVEVVKEKVVNIFELAHKFVLVKALKLFEVWDCFLDLHALAGQNVFLAADEAVGGA